VLTVEQLNELIESSRTSLFRWEALPCYEVATDGSDFGRWLAGEPEPNWARKQPWLDYLRAEAMTGRRRRRVRLIHDPPTDYELFACEWGYALNVRAGEEVLVLDLARTSLPTELVGVEDFWLVDDSRVVLMHYNDDATFRGATPLEAELTPRYRNAMLAARSSAEDFTQWWAGAPRRHAKRNS